MKKAIISLVNRKLVPILPGSIKSNPTLRYLYSRALFKRIPGESKMVLLYTLPKSGTHYFMFFLSNYLMIQFKGATLPMSYDELDGFIPNSTDRLRVHYSKYKPPHTLFAATPYKDIIHGHEDVGIEFSPAKIVALYRNPLDFMVSNYYYRYVNRRSVTEKPESADAIVDEWLPHLIKTYRLMDRLGRKSNSILVSYEEIMRYPEAAFTSIVRWLGLPLNMDNVRMAIEFSRIENIRKYEDEHGPIVADKSNFTGKYFTRSGKIGEWKDELKPETVSYIRDQLEANGINFSRFIVE